MEKKIAILDVKKFSAIRRLAPLTALFWLACMPTLLAQDIGVLQPPGPLSEAHAKLEGQQNCEKCHEPGKDVSAC